MEVVREEAEDRARDRSGEEHLRPLVGEDGDHQEGARGHQAGARGHAVGAIQAVERVRDPHDPEDRQERRKGRRGDVEGDPRRPDHEPHHAEFDEQLAGPDAPEVIREADAEQQAAPEQHPQHLARGSPRAPEDRAGDRREHRQPPEERGGPRVDLPMVRHVDDAPPKGRRPGQGRESEAEDACDDERFKRHTRSARPPQS